MILKSAVSLILLLSSFSSFCQQTGGSWQQEVNYSISVSLNDQTMCLTGFEKIEYVNHSPDTLSFIWFHLWPNAYRNNTTAFAKQFSAHPGGKSALKRMEHNGYIDSLKFMVNDVPAIVISDVQHIDIIKVFLPNPVLPGRSVTISTPFKVQLPPFISRSGYSETIIMACQWYPKPAVYDHKGWHPMPYLEQGEFYSDFGKMDVSITVPPGYVVAATGVLQNQEELKNYRQVGSNNYKTKPNKLYPGTKDIANTLRFYIENVHDFAWFADKTFIIEYDTLLLESGRIVDVFAFHPKKGSKLWDSAVNFIKDAVRNYSKWIGEYPYPVVQAVEGPVNISSGGMEYPTITLITTPNAYVQSLDAIITHEIGHNWFYGVLGTNERDHPWMDEGLNTYYQFRYEAEKYQSNSVLGRAIPTQLNNLASSEFLGFVYNTLSDLPMYQPIETKSILFKNKDEYGIVAYIKAAIWMYIIELTIGRELLDSAMQHYYSLWKFRHPYPEDLKQSLEQKSNLKMDELFLLLSKYGRLN